MVVGPDRRCGRWHQAVEEHLCCPRGIDLPIAWCPVEVCVYPESQLCVPRLDKPCHWALSRLVTMSGPPLPSRGEASSLSLSTEHRKRF